MDHLKKICYKSLALATEFCNTREKIAKQLEFILNDEEKEKILTAHYRDNVREKIRLLFSDDYKQGIALKWVIFNTILIMCNRLWKTIRKGKNFCVYKDEKHRW